MGERATGIRESEQFASRHAPTNANTGLTEGRIPMKEAALQGAQI